jgi:hypothetical protein
MIWMWDAAYRALEDPSTPETYQHKCAPISHPQHIRTLFIYMIWLRDAIYGALEPQP